MPDSEDAWELLGLQAFEHKALPSVIPLFQQQAERSPAQPWPHLWLGEAYLRNQDLPQALQSFKKAVELSPQLARAQFSLGFAYKELGENTLAVEALRRAASLAPENPLAHFHLGDLLSQAEDQQAAIKELQRAVELKPDYAEAHVELGQAYLKQKRYAEAVEDRFAEELRCNPTLPSLITFSAGRIRAWARIRMPPKHCSASSSCRRSRRQSNERLGYKAIRPHAPVQKRTSRRYRA